MPAWTELRRSGFFAWFDLSEVGGSGRTIHLKPGGYQDFIDLDVTVDPPDAVRDATLTLDRCWVADERTSPFAIDITRSFARTFAPDDREVAELAERLWSLLEENPRVVVRAGAIPSTVHDCSPTVRDAVDAYLGRRRRAVLGSPSPAIVFENLLDGGGERLAVAWRPESPGH